MEKASRFGVFLMAGLLAAPLCFGQVPRAIAPSTPDFESATTYFYKHPNPALVTQILAGFGASPLAADPGAQPGMIGFLAASFQRYPQDIDRLIPANLSPPALWVTAVALHLAGQDGKAKALFDTLAAKGAEAPDFSRLPASLDQVKADDAGAFDLLWGASFASGDPRYCAKILAHVAAVANEGGGNADDMVAIVKASAKGLGKDQLKWVVDKHGADKARELLVTSSALWSLHANAQQHDFVRAVVDDYVKTHPHDPLSKALLAL